MKPLILTRLVLLASLFLVQPVFSLEADQQQALEYLNQMRTQAGLIRFVSDQRLQSSAQSHADYLTNNNLQAGHYQNKSQYPSGFTGNTPAERAVSAGYQTTQVSENVSSGQQDFVQSLDGLMSAIYHRFAFFNPVLDSIGLAYSQYADGSYAYVYNMSHSAYEQLCRQSGSITGGYYTGVCASDTPVDAAAYTAIASQVWQQTPELIVWPVSGASDIPPVFYEESPDPLPDYSVSGYPVSIEVNPEKLDNFVLESFLLFDEATGQQINDVRLLTDENDPNGKFTATQFALFPLQRLENSHHYRVFIKYRANGQQYVRSWSFQTAALSDNELVFTISNPVETLNLSLEQSRFTLYFPPTDQYPGFLSYSSRYTAGMDPVIRFVDQNTLDISLTPAENGQLLLSLEDGRSVTIYFSGSNTPQQQDNNAENKQVAIWEPVSMLLSLPAIAVADGIYSAVLSLQKITDQQLLFSVLDVYQKTAQEEAGAWRNSRYDGRQILIDKLMISGQQFENIALTQQVVDGQLMFSYP